MKLRKKRNIVFCPSLQDAKLISEQLTQRHFVDHTTITFLEPIDYHALNLAARLAGVKFCFEGDRRSININQSYLLSIKP